MFFNYKEVYYLYFNKILCIYIYIYAIKVINIIFTMYIKL